MNFILCHTTLELRDERSPCTMKPFSSTSLLAVPSKDWITPFWNFSSFYPTFYKEKEAFVWWLFVPSVVFKSKPCQWKRIRQRFLWSKVANICTHCFSILFWTRVKVIFCLTDRIELHILRRVKKLVQAAAWAKWEIQMCCLE